MTLLENSVREVIENHGGDKESFVRDILQYGCVSGIVSELIYYADIHTWFNKHYDDIMELVAEYEEMTGERIQYEGDLKNWFAWFSFEETVRKLYGDWDE